MSFIINICAVVAILIFLYYAYYFIRNYFVRLKNRRIASLTNPPGDYMQNTGIQCPDYWVNTGVDQNGNYICKNSFNIQTNNSCNSEIIKFPSIQSLPVASTWEYGNPNGLQTLTQDQKYAFLNTNVNNNLSRCDWVQKCGPGQNIMGTWQGVNEICTNPNASPIQ